MPALHRAVLFFEGNDCTQDNIGTLDPTRTWKLNLQSNHQVEHDEARSLRLRNVQPGTVIRLYDSPHGDLHDDWTEVRVIGFAREVDIGTFERNMILPTPTPLTNPVVTVTHHHHNGLDGKVSRIEVDPGPVNSPVTRVHEALYDSFLGWPDKGGMAWRHLEGNHNYRVWRPNLIQGLHDGSIAFVLKMDHIRAGFADDHARIDATFAPDGRPTVLKMTVELQGRSAVSRALSNLGDLAAWEPRLIIAKVASLLVDMLEDMGETGGRLLFPRVVELVAFKLHEAMLEASA